MKIYVVGGATHYTSFIRDVELVNNIEEAQIVMFTGGEDVDPSLYGCEKHPRTHSNIERDLYEKEMFEKVKENQLCVGCCRGSQLLCILNGGLLVQDCTNHAIYDTHPIANNNYVYEITSTHHQMQYPFNLDAEDYDILYKSHVLRSTHYYGDKINRSIITDIGEPEVVLYHKKGLPRCLAIQGHPEMIPNSPVSEMLNNLMYELVDGIA